MVSQVSMEAEAGSHADKSESEEDSDSEDSEWEEEEEDTRRKKSEFSGQASLSVICQFVSVMCQMARYLVTGIPSYYLNEMEFGSKGICSDGLNILHVQICL